MSQKMLKKLQHFLQHWSPVVLLSIAANVALLQLFVWLIAVKDFKTPQPNSISVLLTHNSQQQSVPTPIPETANKTPIKKPIVKKTQVKTTQAKKLKAVKPPPKKTLPAVKKVPDVPPEPAEPEEVTPTEIVEQPVESQQAEVNVDSKPKEAQNDDNPQSRQEPLAPVAIEAVPLFRLTRMPKRLDYDRDALKRFYPREERDFGKVATVEAMILVDEHGDVVDVQIVKSAGANFDAAAKKALLSKLVTVQPGYIGDKPVPSWVPIPITFSLTD
jgi:TonB family protein